MHRFILAHLRRRAGRTLALLSGLLVTTTGFIVLSGTTATSRLEVTGTVQAGTRAAYDILVRPAGSRSTVEAEDGLVRPNYLAGLFGGLTTPPAGRPSATGHCCPVATRAATCRRRHCC